MLAVALDRVRKSYGENLVLDEINLNGKNGEILAVLGPSGCGKSTILHIIAGLVKQDAGDIYLNGEIINGTAPEKRPVGLVLQDYMLFPHLNVYENVSFGLKMRKKYPDHKVKQIVQEKLQLLEIENIWNCYPTALSGGQQQRVALARALATEPEILLLDEPLNNLDARVREYLRFELKHMLKKKLGITTIMVTHDQTEAISMADNVAILHNKIIEQIGKPDEIFFKPKTEYVAQFVGYENIYKGSITEIDPETGTVKVAIKNLEITASISPELSTGDQVLVSIRSDDITILSDQHMPKTGNVLKGKIEEKIFLGFSIRLKVTVKENNLDFTIIVPRQLASEVELAQGKELYLIIKPTDINLIKISYCECKQNQNDK